ncbi:hypothetical protein [Sulfoacidibacillus thermotolerans]|uniref:VOC domain-containing protein n=1 Tax=Sulfoacidibacillus thermotolerans TaxID=1765684 RepID=A0A2U3DAV6_SULT2|nr:hypothetical protein [Sulfoacidibacillus thermotolerans]PWI58414.1 hypothetical protein BM613_04175 [Sulfoacidibacillus thermotolerans]
MPTTDWPEDLPVAEVRIACPTDKLDEVVRFYTDGIGLKHIGGFKGHQGYDGEIVGLPGISYHLEFTQHVDGSPCPAPTNWEKDGVTIEDPDGWRVVLMRRSYS